MQYNAKLMRIALTVSAYSGGIATLTYTVPQGLKLAMIGLSVNPLAALNDHQVTSFLHNEYQAIKTSSVLGTDYGVPLGHVASYLGAESYLDGTRRATGNRMQFWPGRLQVPGVKCGDGVSMIALKENATVTITVKRLYGATSIDKAYLWVVPLSVENHARRCNGQQNVVDRPQWIGQLISLAAAANSVKAVTETRWDAYDDRAIQLRQRFATVYVNTAGTLSFDATYADAVYASQRDWDDRPLVPLLIENQDRISELAPIGLQSFDCSRDPQMVIPPKTGLRTYTTRDVTAQIKDVYLSFYGSLLDAQEMTGELIDVS